MRKVSSGASGDSPRKDGDGGSGEALGRVLTGRETFPLPGQVSSERRRGLFAFTTIPLHPLPSELP